MQIPKFGVEYTFVYKDQDDSDINGENYGEVIDKLRQADPATFANTGDDQCVEVRSRPTRDLYTARKFYDRMMRQIDRHGLTARLIKKRPDGTEDYYGTGGGHIHIELPGPSKLRKRVMYNLVAMVANRPWLGWVFNEFMDNNNAKALCRHDDVKKFMNGEFWLKRQLTWSAFNEEDPDDPYQLALRQLGGKDWAIRFKKWNQRTMTVEFRFFDAPRSWNQAQEHIMFALRFYQAALQAAKAGRECGRVVRTQRQFDRFKGRKAALAEFRKTIQQLGLRWKDYWKYMRNFDDRKAFGEMV